MSQAFGPQCHLHWAFSVVSRSSETAGRTTEISEPAPCYQSVQKKLKDGRFDYLISHKLYWLYRNGYSNNGLPECITTALIFICCKYPLKEVTKSIKIKQCAQYYLVTLYSHLVDVMGIAGRHAGAFSANSLEVTLNNKQLNLLLLWQRPK